jgi:secondary thiamine-phosphate synthase enzyme
MTHNYEEKIEIKEEFTDITDLVQSFIDSHNITNGLCLVYSKHTTTCIRILENEELLKKDMHDFFERLSSSNCQYRHDDIERRSVPPDERRNGFSHLRAMLLNHQELIPIINGKLDLGKWQKIFYIECDPIRLDRTLNIRIMED